MWISGLKHPRNRVLIGERRIDFLGSGLENPEATGASPVQSSNIL
jgi:hypothetical protein